MYKALSCNNNASDASFFQILSVATNKLYCILDFNSMEPSLKCVLIQCVWLLWISVTKSGNKMGKNPIILLQCNLFLINTFKTIFNHMGTGVENVTLQLNYV